MKNFKLDGRGEISSKAIGNKTKLELPDSNESEKANADFNVSV